jgi:hypothetical protein
MKQLSHILVALTALFIGNTLSQEAHGCSSAYCSFQNETHVVDVQHYYLDLDFGDIKDRTLVGTATLTLAVREIQNTIELDFEGLTTDSVLLDGAAIQFSVTTTTLTVDLGKTLSPGETIDLVIHYHGKPKRDASWGGFYFSGEYAFNLGVAFTSDPHNYGRIWYPCIDKFTDRATYEYSVTCDTPYRAYCNGLLQSVTKSVDGSKQIFHWKMDQSIPTYLSSVAIAPYEEVSYTHNNIPITLVSMAKDTADMKSSFKNLNTCIDAFIHAYGPHNFDRIGFNAVPFNGGAMEHATNIAYPIFGIDGSLAFETLFAHELAHHWWGNSVTCETAEDMWLNEGWASFSESLFLEFVYGKERYKSYTSDNHRNVLHYAHLRDGGALPVSGVGHSNTYGSHVYSKGADMVHTLRGWMGDSAFFEACSTFIEERKFTSITTDDMATEFQKHTSTNLTPFFNEWIKKPGSPNFDIIGFKSTKRGEGYKTEIRIRQRLRFAEDLYTQVPLEVTFMDASMQKFTTRFIVEGSKNWYEVQTPFLATYAALDLEEKISDAVSDNAQVVSDTGFINFPSAMMNVQVKSITDSAFLRVEHHWVAPDGYYHKTDLPVLSRERYWRVDGVGLEKMQAQAIFPFNGRNSGTNYAAGYLDIELLRNEPEDKLVMMYREHASADWKACDDCEIISGNTIFDRKGEVLVRNLKPGEYALAIRDTKLLSTEKEVEDAPSAFEISPNPADKILVVNWHKKQEVTVEILDRKGQLVYQKSLHNKQIEVPLDTLSRGVYYVGVIIDGKPYHPKAFIVRGSL